jgi:signal transduction histidine kinase
MLTNVLEVNWTILYFVYGQVFFIMGLAISLRWRRRSHLDLARSLPWLAAFGVAHGLNEWGYIFIPLQSIYLGATAVQLMVIAHLLLLALSFFFLLQYGIELVLPLVPRRRWLRAVPAVMLLVWALAVLTWGLLTHDSLTVLFDVGDALSRYLLCLPGAILSSVGLLRHSARIRKAGLTRIGGYLTGAAVAFLVYAVAGGLLVPAAPFFPANSLNYEVLNSALRIPVPVFRSICGLAMAVFVVRSLEIFHLETDSRIAAMEQARLLAEDHERIGRELHDGIIQEIYATGLSLEVARQTVPEQPAQAQARIQSAMQALNTTVEDIRRYIFDLRAAEQSHKLESILEDLVREVRLDTMVEASLEVVGQRCCILSPAQSSDLAQIAREALSNTVQHAQAAHVTVSLSYMGTETRLAVADDGKGVDLASLENGNNAGQGLANMRARARLLGGTLEIDSESGHGFRLVATIPCGGNCAAGTQPDPAVVWLA